MGAIGGRLPVDASHGGGSVNVKRFLFTIMRKRFTLILKRLRFVVRWF
jgi:hypothetical protein